MSIVAVFSTTNLVYQVARKPTEIFFPVSGAFDKSPAETWLHYVPLFREYSIASISPELLATVAQVEGAGNPVASTYWRWSLAWNPFAMYQPASSSVGMYQMTDAAFAEARRYCIRHHTVVEDSCSLTGFDSRVLPSRAIELTCPCGEHRRRWSPRPSRPDKAAHHREHREVGPQWCEMLPCGGR
jgi:hypothetical protein